MEIIINIDDGYYNWVINNKSNDPYEYKNATELEFRKALEHGIPLPKDHGDLIDVDVAFKEAVRNFDKACLSWD